MERHEWDGLWLGVLAFALGAGILVFGMFVVDFMLWEGDALRYFLQTFWRWAP